MHQGDILTIDDRVHRQVALNTMLITRLSHLFQVVDGECGGRVRPHIQLLDTEIDTVSTSLNSCSQRLWRAHRSHNLKILQFHIGCKITK